MSSPSGVPQFLNHSQFSSVLPESLSLQLLSLLGILVAFATKFLQPSSSAKGKALPTPRGLPWAGPVWAVDGSNIYKTFTAWAQKLGTLYEVKLFGQNLIIISDPQIAKEVLAQKASIASDRPALAVVEGSKDSGKYLPFLGNNDMLTRQRRFGVLINTYTHKNNYHNRFLPETIRFAYRILEKQDDPLVLIEQFCGRLSCRMAFGTPAPHVAVTQSAHTFMKHLSPGGKITNVMNFLRHVPTFFSSDKQTESVRIDMEDRIWYGIFEKVKQASQAGTLKPSYAKYYFDNTDKVNLTEQEALYGVVMMATVSILTLIAPIQRWIVALCENPEWQDAVHKEITEQLQGRMAEHTDSPKLPVLRATILESLRWASPVPTGIPHRLEDDITYKGYHLSKNSNVLACDWSMTHSPAIYSSPNEFLPTRYLNPSSNSYSEPLDVYPKIQGHTVFGFGRRVCIGQEYATAQLITVCAALCTFFRFEMGTAPDGTKKTSQQCIEGSTPHVLPVMNIGDVDVKFATRDDESAQKLRNLYKDLRETDDEKHEDECL